MRLVINPDSHSTDLVDEVVLLPGLYGSRALITEVVDAGGHVNTPPVLVHAHTNVQGYQGAGAPRTWPGVGRMCGHMLYIGIDSLFVK